MMTVMDDTRRRPLRTGGRLWGPERVRLGMSLDQLAALTGINKGILSMAENGRIIPTGDEYDRVRAALTRSQQGAA